ncbi:MAG: iron ABC transporter permease [Pseudomonadota bacterium]
MDQAVEAKVGQPAKDRVLKARQAHAILALLLAGSCVASLTIGATNTSLWTALAKLLSGETLSQTEQIVLWQIRMPRTLLGVVVGAGLAVSGAIMQGLFRNPLADPGIVGVSAGAGLGAIMAIVLGASLPLWIQVLFGPYLLPLSAFLGSWIVVLILYAAATRNGQTSVATMLLAGIAIAALTGALSGILIYLSNDQQLRDLTFWQLGSLSGATWNKVLTAGPIIALAIALSTALGHGLNGLAMGETTAMHLGIAVQRIKRLAVLATAAATGAAVAVSGGIGFIGIVVPHLLRLSTGPDHGPLLINSALLGAALLLWADVVARIIVAPVELPIGIVTAIIGSPVFLWILLRRRGGFVM